MKKFFTLIAAVAMAASVNAQTAKVFTESTYLATSADNVAKWIAEGWVAEGSGKTAADNKKGNINPETGEDVGEGKYKVPGIDLKQGASAKAFKMAITGVSSIEAYGVTTSSSDTRYVVVTATPDGGEAIVKDASTAPGYTAVVKVDLDKTKTYTVDITGVKEDKTGGGDIALHGIKIIAGTSTGISSAIVDAVSCNGATYNLAGQQVSKSYKGLVIKNGKKFINK